MLILSHGLENDYDRAPQWLKIRKDTPHLIFTDPK